LPIVSDRDRTYLGSFAFSTLDRTEYFSRFT
jgi:hypothetical protein